MKIVDEKVVEELFETRGWLDEERGDEDEWDVMILHLLAVDHIGFFFLFLIHLSKTTYKFHVFTPFFSIGHTYGPDSSHMKEELGKLDEIFDKVTSKIKLQDEASNSSTLLLLMGDHGYFLFDNSFPMIIIMCVLCVFG